MSNAAPQSGEPTMEEILASIRRIISEEEQDPTLKPDAVAAPEAGDDAPPADDEVFELTNVVAEEPAPPPPAPRRPTLVSPAEDIAFDAPQPAPVRAAEPLHEPAEEQLVAPAVIDRAGAAFERLHRTASFTDAPGGPSIESMIREMIKPMLKGWLDDHLPGIVERIVAEEVERVASRRR